MREHHAVIVGGGISGLSAAFFLSQRASQEHFPLKITVLEALDRLGGVLHTLKHGELLMEAGADAFYAGANDATDLCRGLGLQEDLIEAAPCFRNFFTLKDKKTISIPGLPGSFGDAVQFFKSPLLSFPTKFRLLLEPFSPRWKGDADETLASFICRRLGRDFYRESVRPWVQGVYMMDPERLSLETLFPKLRQAERIHGSLTGSFLKKAHEKKENDSAEFLTLKQGLEGLIQALVRGLEGCELRKSAFVRQCIYHKGWEISLEDGEVLRADILGFAMNACDASGLISEAAPELSGALSALRYDSIATINLIYKSEDVPGRVPGPGFLIPGDGKQYPFSSLKWLGKSADGKYVLMRVFLSEAMMPGVFNESDETLNQKIRDFLNDFFGIRAQPLLSAVKRYFHALPQYETGHLEWVARIEKMGFQYPGLFFTGNGSHGFGITDCIRQARLAVSGLRFPIL